jgi:hypothetical protein
MQQYLEERTMYHGLNRKFGYWVILGDGHSPIGLMKKKIQANSMHKYRFRKKSFMDKERKALPKNTIPSLDR